MYNEKIIVNLEKILDSLQDLKTPLDYEKASLILERKRVSSYLEKLFEGAESVDEIDLNGMTKNKFLRNVMKLYLIRNQIPIKKAENVSVSDLSFILRQYKEALSLHVTFTDEEIEMLLEDKSIKNRNCVVSSLLDFVFSTVLSGANDINLFEELLSNANDELLSSYYRYDKTKHKNFKEFLSYNLEMMLEKKQHEYIVDEVPYKTSGLIANNYDEYIVKRTDDLILLKEIIESANLSILERKVVEYIYGLTDGMPHTYEEAAREFNMSKFGANHVGIEAMTKLRKTQKKRS